MLSPQTVVLREATFGNHTLHFNKELCFPIVVEHDAESGIVWLTIDNDELSINVFSQTHHGLIQELQEQIHLIYNQYVCADSEILTERAQKLRLRWCALIDKKGFDNA